MADTINHTWQTVEQAAVTLNCSTRTIARRIAGETIESRVDDNGRRLVLVETFAGSATAADGDDRDTRQTSDVGPEIDENVLAVAGATSMAKPLPGGNAYNPAAASVLAVLQTTIDAARTDAARARTGARWAWAGAAVMAAGIGATALLLTGRLTRAETKVEMLQGDVVAAKTDLDRSRSDLLILGSAKAVADERRDSAEQKLVSSIDRQKQLEGSLAELRQTVSHAAAVVDSSPRRPATQPSLLSRLVTLPIDDGR